VQTALEQRMMTSERDREGVSTGNIYWGVREKLIQREARTLRRGTTGLTNEVAQNLGRAKERPALGMGNGVSLQCNVPVTQKHTHTHTHRQTQIRTPVLTHTRKQAPTRAKTNKCTHTRPHTLMHTHTHQIRPLLVKTKFYSVSGGPPARLFFLCKKTELWS
jgi:hypothetical protein